MASRRDIVAGGAAVEIKAIDQATKVVRDVTSNFIAAGKEIASMGMKLVAASSAASVAIVALSVVTASMAAAVDDAAKRTGVTAEALQELRYGAEQSGAGFDDLVAGFRNMNKELAGDGAAEKLAAIGLNIDDIKKLKPDEQFVAIADAIARIKDSALQTDAAMSIFGKGGFALLPFMQEGSKGIEQFRKDAQRLGIVLSGDIISSFAEYDDAVARITSSTKAIAALFAASFLPVLQPIADAVTEVTAVTATWLAQNQEIGSMLSAGIAAVAGLGVVLMGLGSILAGPISLMASFATIASGFFGVFGAASLPIIAVAAAFGALLAVGLAVFAGWAAMTLITADYDTTVRKTSESVIWLAQEINSLYESLVSTFGPAIEGVITALRDADFYSAGKLAFMGLQLAVSEVFQWVIAFCFARVGDIYSIISKLVGYISTTAATAVDDFAARLKTEALAVNLGFEGGQQKLRDDIGTVKKGVDERSLEKGRIAALEASAREDEEWEKMEDAYFAKEMQKKMDQQKKTGFEPAGDPTKTIGTASSGLASMVVAPMAGMMQPVVSKLDEQLNTQKQIEKNTANGPTFGA